MVEIDFQSNLRKIEPILNNTFIIITNLSYDFDKSMNLIAVLN